MVKFKFFVHCAGWAAGGYENTHFAKTPAEARQQIDKWNKERPGSVSLVSIAEISDAEFAEDYIY